MVVPVGAVVRGAEVTGSEVTRVDDVGINVTAIRIVGTALGLGDACVIRPPPQPQHISGNVKVSVS